MKHVLCSGFVVVLASWMLGAEPAEAQAEAQPTMTQGVDLKAERERLARERAAVDARFSAEERACYQQFVVSSCVSAAKSRQRDALADIRRQETALNNAERLARGAKAQQRIDEAQSPDTAADRERERQLRVEQTARQQAEADKAAERRFDKASQSAGSRDAAAAKSAQAQAQAEGRTAKAVEAQAKRAAYEKKLADAQRRQAEAVQKQADQKKPRAASLTPGAALPAPGVPSGQVKPAVQP